jgi:hypothetical protein
MAFLNPKNNKIKRKHENNTRKRHRGVFSEGLYALHHRGVLDILFWAVLLEW